MDDESELGTKSSENDSQNKKSSLSQLRGKRNSPRISPRSSGSLSEKSSPIPGHGLVTQPSGGAKRDREMQSDDNDSSCDTSSDDSNKKIRKEVPGEGEMVGNKDSTLKKKNHTHTTKEQDDEGTNSASRKSRPTDGKPKICRKKLGSTVNNIGDDETMSCDKNEDEAIDFSDASKEQEAAANASGSGTNNDSTNKSSNSNSNSSTSNNNSSSSSRNKSKEGETNTSSSPLKRRRSYRERLEESSEGEHEEGESSNSVGAAAAGVVRRRRSSSKRGELRDTSVGRTRRHTAVAELTDEPPRESRSSRLARFLATDSDTSEPAEPRRPSRGRQAEAPAAEAGPAAEEDESVGQRVRRRRVGRGGRERRGEGGSGGGSRARRNRSMVLSTSSDSSSSDTESEDDSDDSEDGLYSSRPRRRRIMPEQVEAEVKAEMKAIQDKKWPKHDFHVTKEIINRQYCGGVCGPRIVGGAQSRYGLYFAQRYYTSFHVVQRLELMAKLDHHQGCVNAIGFSNSGSVLVSGSDDLQVALWNWNREKLIMSFESGHRNNVFQCKFMAMPGDRHIVTCARDGQVRLAEVSEGVCRSTRRLAKHNGPSHKLAVTPSRPQIVLSAGEDGQVKEADLRQENANTIAITTDDTGSRVALYSIHNHPLNDNQFCVAGRDQYVCVYDRRITTNTAPPVLKYCPDHLQSSRPRANVTCAVYSNNGDAILASYNDEDIYLFDTAKSCGEPYTHRYSGHRNSATVKGVNMFGPCSQYVMSGSDCGNIFIWSRETEAIVRCFGGDENGVVNVLEWHPHLPLLATSGLDSDVKLWIPTGHNLPDNDKLNQIVEKNLRDRRNSSSDVDLPDGRMIMMIWDHMRRLQGNRGGGGADAGDGGQRRGSQQRGDASNSSDDDNPFSGGASGNLQCATQ